MRCCNYGHLLRKLLHTVLFCEFIIFDCQVRRSGYARRAGIRVNDTIVQINETPADPLTLREAQLLIRQSGKQVKIYVKG